ncbi:MAG: hypothetical protein JWO80_4272, partial [Bryobacterales bacterium]|nr:hypothetical protein [Bryobacterales bacterium]
RRSQTGELHDCGTPPIVTRRWLTIRSPARIEGIRTNPTLSISSEFAGTTDAQKMGSSAILVQFHGARLADKSELWKRKYACTEEIEADASVHLTLDGFQPVDLSFHLTAAPFRFCGCSNR